MHITAGSTQTTSTYNIITDNVIMNRQRIPSKIIGGIVGGCLIVLVLLLVTCFLAICYVRIVRTGKLEYTMSEVCNVVCS